MVTAAVTLVCVTFSTPRWERISDDLKTGQPILKSLREINDFVNAVPYVEDINNYGVSDYWASPSEFFQRRAGDCEDYAIAKYAMALEAGLIKPEDGRIVLVRDRKQNGIPHVILIIKDDVLDNQSKGIFKMSSNEMKRYEILGEVKK